MRNFDEMKALVLEIADSDYEIPESMDKNSFIADMLRFIGDTDSVLREGIYELIWEWTSGDILSAEQLRHITFSCLDDKHMFFGIGEEDTDTVFARSFSSLTLHTCIDYDKYKRKSNNPFLTEKEIVEILHKVMQYIDQEHDYRGYVKERGWAHSVAHIADVLKVLTFCVEHDGITQILTAIGQLVSNKSLVYEATEDERLADAVISGVLWAGCYKGDYFSVKELCDWLKDTFVMVERKVMPDDYNINANRKAFIKSMYAKTMTDSDLHENEEIFRQFHDCLFEIVTELYAG
ncbi:MAG: DUF2785 domain-containing protein [Defluviitaleaceae bacterium]|nr:DUF2785 domain-containing protein [Defluviitaleaceae bacterium]